MRISLLLLFFILSVIFKQSTGSLFNTKMAVEALLIPYQGKDIPVWRDVDKMKMNKLYYLPQPRLLVDDMKCRWHRGSGRLVLPILMKMKSMEAVIKRQAIEMINSVIISQGKGNDKLLKEKYVYLHPIPAVASKLEWANKNDGMQTKPAKSNEEKKEKNNEEEPKIQYTLNSYWSKQMIRALQHYDMVFKNMKECREFLKYIKAHVQNWQGRLQMVFIVDAKKGAQRRIELRKTQIGRAELLTQLKQMKGAEGNDRYLTAADATRFATEIRNHMEVEELKDEEYEKGNDEVKLQTFIKDSLFGVRTFDTKDLTEKQWKSVFWDPNSVRPDVSTKILNKVYKKDKTDSSKLLYKKNVAEDLMQGNLGSDHSMNFGGKFLDIVSANGGMSTSMKASATVKGKREYVVNKKDMLKLMKESNVQSEWTGEKFEPKSLELQRVNLGTIESSDFVTVTSIHLKQITRKQEVNVELETHSMRTIDKLLSRVDNAILSFNESLKEERKIVKAIADRVQTNEQNIDKIFTITNEIQKRASITSTVQICESCLDCSDKPDYSGRLILKDGSQVKCNQGWTSIMHMRDGDSLDTKKTWVEYENGFGDLSASHWTGLKLITNIMSKKNSWKLRYFGVTAPNEGRTLNFKGQYNTFSLDAAKNYTLHVGSFIGDATDNLLSCSAFLGGWNQNGSPFSTIDRNNDKREA